jgi:hypothetical protein
MYAMYPYIQCIHVSNVSMYPMYPYTKIGISSFLYITVCLLQGRALLLARCELRDFGEGRRCSTGQHVRFVTFLC